MIHVLVTVRTPTGRVGTVDCCGFTAGEALHTMALWQRAHPTFETVAWEFQS